MCRLCEHTRTHACTCSYMLERIYNCMSRQLDGGEQGVEGRGGVPNTCECLLCVRKMVFQ